MALVCPSLRAADFSRLGEQLEIIRQAGGRMIHIDVSDGHFVPDVGFGVPVIESIRRATDLTLDVHLLIERPERILGEFIGAGADRIAIHPEATTNLFGALRLIHSRGAIGGVALLPATPLSFVTEVVPDLDFLNILSADPGEAEGGYIPRSLSKLRAAAELRARHDGQFSLQVEGAISSEERLQEALRAGANIVVISGDCFGEPNATATLREWLQQASVTSEGINTAEGPL